LAQEQEAPQVTDLQQLQDRMADKGVTSITLRYSNGFWRVNWGKTGEVAARGVIHALVAFQRFLMGMVD
jgi:hypothetical protein